MSGGDSNRSDDCTGTIGRMAVVLAAALSLGGVGQVEAAYRVVLQDGSSFEVRTIEDLGDAIRYQRLGGTMVVPKGNVVSITEVPDPPPPAPPPAARPPVPSPLAPSTGQGPAIHPPAVPGVSASRPEHEAAPRFPPAVKAPDGTAMVSGAVSIIGGFALLLLLAAAVLLMIRFLIRRNTMVIPGAMRLPYEKAGPLLTPAERSFYGVLDQAVDGQRVFAKVRLGDLLDVVRGTPRPRVYRNKIDRKHVDFVLCNARTLVPELVIELDDRSHDRLDRQERDAFVDAALEAAGLPILHVAAKRAYIPTELRALLTSRLTGASDPAEVILR